MPWLSASQARVDAHAVASALENPSRWTPRAELVIAIIRRESRGFPHVCGEDRFGGSARGLMQVRRPSSRCSMRHHDPLYVPEIGVREGVRILTTLAKFEAEQHDGKHDILVHYSGGSQSYATHVRETERNLSR